MTNARHSMEMGESRYTGSVNHSGITVIPIIKPEKHGLPRPLTVDLDIFSWKVAFRL